MIIIHDLLCIIYTVFGQLLPLIVYHFRARFYMKAYENKCVNDYSRDNTIALSTTSALIVAPSGASPFKIKSDTGSSINR